MNWVLIVMITAGAKFGAGTSQSDQVQMQSFHTEERCQAAASFIRNRAKNSNIQTLCIPQ